MQSKSAQETSFTCSPKPSDFLAENLNLGTEKREMCHGIEPKNLMQVQAFKYTKAEKPHYTGHEILEIFHYLFVHSNKNNSFEFPRINNLSIKKTNEPECC